MRVTMHATQHDPFVVHDSPDGAATAVFPSRGRTVAMDQTHWFTVADGKIAEHDAVRDDLGMAQQLGWVPPTPAYLIAMKRGHSRAPSPTPLVADRGNTLGGYPADVIWHLPGSTAWDD